MTTLQERQDNKNAGQPPRPWVRRADVSATLFIAAIFVALVTVIVIRQHAAGKEVEVIRSQGGIGTYLIDLNRAEAAELRLLPGVGPARAERILAWRREHGPFRSFEEVRKAAALSANDMERLRNAATLGVADAAPASGADFVEPEVK